MQIFNDLKAWQLHRKSIDSTKTIGFVPTMGNLHQGHASLIQQSKNQNSLTLVSIFVNPTQFNNEEDFSYYPRTLEQDLHLLQELNVDFCLLPDTRMIYPEGEHTYQINENSMSQRLEGQFRPGHFSGVLTVVLKLFHIVQPQQAFFGEKDYQQYQLIKNMTSAFFMPIDVILCPTIREKSNLAYSSRNNRLNPEERLKAEEFAALFHQSDKQLAEIIEELKEREFLIDYIEEIEQRRYAAIFIGKVRLIDNYLIQ